MIGDGFLGQMRNFMLMMKDPTAWTSGFITVENI